jgi:hypothetical protein
VWRYFQRKKDGFAVYKFYSKKLKTSGNTTNLLGQIQKIYKNHLSDEEFASKSSHLVPRSEPNYSNVSTASTLSVASVADTEIEPSFDSVEYVQVSSSMSFKKSLPSRTYKIKNSSTDTGVAKSHPF